MVHGIGTGFRFHKCGATIYTALGATFTMDGDFRVTASRREGCGVDAVQSAEPGPEGGGRDEVLMGE